MTRPTEEKAGPLRQAVSALGYASVVFALGFYAIATAKDVFDARAEVARLSDGLADLTARARPGAEKRAAAAALPVLLQPTVTLAGAALQQRIERAVAKAGGALQSSSVDLDGPGAKDGFLHLTANLEIAQAGLQPLLYDLEAGSPYLFVETLHVQSPQAFGESEKGGLRVALTVSSKWEPGG